MSLRKKRSQTWPPSLTRPDETEEERITRVAAETNAKRVSDMIDRQLDAERQRRKEKKGPKILLLGMLCFRVKAK